MARARAALPVLARLRFLLILGLEFTTSQIAGALLVFALLA